MTSKETNNARQIRVKGETNEHIEEDSEGATVKVGITGETEGSEGTVGAGGRKLKNARPTNGKANGDVDSDEVHSSDSDNYNKANERRAKPNSELAGEPVDEQQDKKDNKASHTHQRALKIRIGKEQLQRKPEGKQQLKSEETAISEAKRAEFTSSAEKAREEARRERLQEETQQERQNEEIKRDDQPLQNIKAEKDEAESQLPLSPGALEPQAEKEMNGESDDKKSERQTDKDKLTIGEVEMQEAEDATKLSKVQAEKDKLKLSPEKDKSQGKEASSETVYNIVNYLAIVIINKLLRTKN